MTSSLNQDRNSGIHWHIMTASTYYFKYNCQIIDVFQFTSYSMYLHFSLKCHLQGLPVYFLCDTLILLDSLKNQGPDPTLCPSRAEFPCSDTRATQPQQKWGCIRATLIYTSKGFGIASSSPLCPLSSPSAHALPLEYLQHAPSFPLHWDWRRVTGLEAESCLWQLLPAEGSNSHVEFSTSQHWLH